MRVVAVAGLLTMFQLAAGQCKQKDGSFTGEGCGYNCDDDCNCGHCNTAPGCLSEDQCMGNCNSGNNAKWCPAVPSPPPAPAPEVDHVCTDATIIGEEACGYNCDDDCNCGRCNQKPGCMSPDTCLGTCNGGGNAKWCGKAPPPPPPTPPVPPPAPPSSWSTASNTLQRNGQNVVLHGFGTTCSEYLLRGIGMDCFTKYTFSDPANALAFEPTKVYPIIDNLLQITDSSVVPVVRVPMTASSWLGINTTASSANLARYPNLDQQYQQYIKDMVETYTTYGIVTLLDLHWSDDDSDNAGFAARTAIYFSYSVAATFADNTMVFYELYNEPHRIEVDAWMNGNDQMAGMLEMLAAVRKHTQTPVVIAGYGGYAYDSDSLISLDGQLGGEKNVMYNFHPYMGPNQAGDSKKCATNFEVYATKVLDGTDKPVIITEFGQSCNPTHGAAENCDAVYDGKTMGYDETILTIADKHGISWMPWAWKGTAKGPNTKNCQDINGGDAGTSLYSPTDDLGGDFAGMWETFANRGLAQQQTVV